MLKSQSLVGMTSKLIIRLIAFIFSFLYLIFICVPLGLFLLVSLELLYSYKGIKRFLKKTIKNAKTKFEPKPIERLS